jgi:hypothetical protein
MRDSNRTLRKNRILNRDSIYEFYFEEPSKQAVGREVGNVALRYFFLKSELKLATLKKEVLNGCLLSGSASIEYGNSRFELKQFDMFFVPPGKDLRIEPEKPGKKSKICLVFSPSEREVDADFDIQRFDVDKFVPRGEPGSEKKMSTYRTIWTAIKNGFFMSGFTNIPNESLRQGVVTSVNLDKDLEGNPEIHPHAHPGIPEVYIYCIAEKSIAVTQYLIDPKGPSVCRDLFDGEGVFFPGNLGHSNFVRPNYENLSYCMYMWIMPTYGRTDYVEPMTLKS